MSSVDLSESSKQAKMPRLPCAWTVDETVLTQRSPDTLGRGFFVQVPFELLPGRFICLAIQLAALSHAMSAQAAKDAGNERRSAILDTRNALQHQLLSLPLVQSDETAQQALAERGLYRCCWLAAVIYSNAVIFALTPHSGWQLTLTKRLQALLETYEYSTWSAGLDDVLLWIVVMGGLASLEGPNAAFFRDALRDILWKRGNPSWPAVMDVLTGFLWLEKACAHAARLLWLSLSDDE